MWVWADRAARCQTVGVSHAADSAYPLEGVRVSDIIKFSFTGPDYHADKAMRQDSIVSSKKL